MAAKWTGLPAVLAGARAAATVFNYILAVCARGGRGTARPGPRRPMLTAAGSTCHQLVWWLRAARAAGRAGGERGRGAWRNCCSTHQTLPCSARGGPRVARGACSTRGGRVRRRWFLQLRRPKQAVAAAMDGDDELQVGAGHVREYGGRVLRQRGPPGMPAQQLLLAL